MGYKKVGVALEKFGREILDRAKMATIATTATAALTKRTFDDGKGKGERNFRRYKKTYREFKRKSGRDVSKVDLTWSGRLRASIRPTKVTNRMAVIGMTGRPKIYGSFVNQSREFMVMSKSVRKATNEAFRAVYKKGRVKFLRKKRTVKS